MSDKDIFSLSVKYITDDLNPKEQLYFMDLLKVDENAHIFSDICILYGKLDSLSLETRKNHIFKLLMNEIN